MWRSETSLRRITIFSASRPSASKRPNACCSSSAIVSGRPVVNSLSGSSSWRSENRSMTASRNPRALSRPESLGHSTVLMPSFSAMAQACCPPAPPKATSAYSAGSYPSRMEIFWTASAIRSLAISRKPASNSSSAVGSGRADRIASSASRAASRFTGMPNWPGSSRPSSRLTSVTVSGPPAP